MYPLLIRTTKAIPEMKSFLILSSTEWALGCAGSAWVYFITWETVEDTVWKTHIPPIPDNISAIVGVSLWPRTSIPTLTYLLAPCISMKIFHVSELAFSHKKLFHPYQLQFSFTSKTNTMGRPACWEIFKSDVLSWMLKGAIFAVLYIMHYVFEVKPH